MHKAQSAMEFLMTYGWGIAITSVILAVLFEIGTFNISSSSVVSSSCLATTGFLCKNPVLVTNGMLFAVIGDQATLVSVETACATGGAVPPSENFSASQGDIVSGSSASLGFSCPLRSGTLGSSFTGTLWIGYTQGSQSFEQAVGLVNVKASETSTLSTSTTSSTTTTSTTSSTTSTSTTTSSASTSSTSSTSSSTTSSTTSASTTISYSHSGATATATSISDSALSAGTWYFCTVEGNSGAFTASWAGGTDENPDTYADIGHQSASGICSATQSGRSKIAMAGVGVNDPASYTLQAKGAATTTPYTFTYTVGDTGQYTFMLFSGATYSMTSVKVSPTSGSCSTLENREDGGYAYIYQCSGQSPNTYTVTVTPSSASGTHHSAYVAYSVG